MFQPRGEEGEEKEITEWRIRKFLRMQSKTKKPQFKKPADMPMTGPSAGGRIAAGGGTLHSYIAKQLGTARNQIFMEDTDIRSSILRHAEEVSLFTWLFHVRYMNRVLSRQRRIHSTSIRPT